MSRILTVRVVAPLVLVVVGAAMSAVSVTLMWRHALIGVGWAITLYAATAVVSAVAVALTVLTVWLLLLRARRLNRSAVRSAGPPRPGTATPRSRSPRA